MSGGVPHECFLLEIVCISLSYVFCMRQFCCKRAYFMHVGLISLSLVCLAIDHFTVIGMSSYRSFHCYALVCLAIRHFIVSSMSSYRSFHCQ